MAVRGDVGGGDGTSVGDAAAWARPALDAVLGRVGVTLADVGARFPLSADPGTGAWTTTRRGSWTGGFWAGLLWLRARHTGAAADREAASACTARLAEWVDADTATRGLILWYGTAAAVDDPAADALRARAADACRAAFDPELGLVPWGAAFGGPRHVARADAVPGLVPLLATAGPRGTAAAAAHLHRHLDLCRGGAVAWHHEPPTGWRPLTDPPPGWSRGRAWLLLAIADALIRVDAETLPRPATEAHPHRTAAEPPGPGTSSPPRPDADVRPHVYGALSPRPGAVAASPCPATEAHPHRTAAEPPSSGASAPPRPATEAHPHR
ncbi:sugar ABC transporter permease, partial [Streptomyces sp. NPDC059003]|uniref:sugar ABC transporter permease n=2 Tax=unclassified Streptomyces TaxID=2593676 RepID=UPI00367AA378